MKYLNMQMRYLICVSTTTEHMDNTLQMDNTSVHWYQVSPLLAHTILWIFAFFVISQLEKNAN